MPNIPQDTIPSYTSGRELYFENGTEYVGNYHLVTSNNTFFTGRSNTDNSIQLFTLQGLPEDSIPDNISVSIQDSDISLQSIQYKIFRKIKRGVRQNIVGVYRDKPVEQEGQSENLYSQDQIESSRKKIVSKNRKGVNVVEIKALVEDGEQIQVDDIQDQYYKLKPSKYLITDSELSKFINTDFTFFVNDEVDIIDGLFDPGTFFRVVTNQILDLREYTYYFVRRNNDICQVPNFQTLEVMLKERNKTYDSIYIIEQDEFFNFNLEGVCEDISAQWTEECGPEAGYIDVSTDFEGILESAEEIASNIANAIPSPPSVLQGSPGTPGQRGDDGRDGKDGQDGKDGDKGDPGDKGDKGDKGDIGEKGKQGEKGDKGEDGKDGKDGEKGDPGGQGPPGQMGPVGPIGSKGDKGDKGDLNVTVTPPPPPIEPPNIPDVPDQPDQSSLEVCTQYTNIQTVSKNDFINRTTGLNIDTPFPKVEVTIPELQRFNFLGRSVIQVGNAAVSLYYAFRPDKGIIMFRELQQTVFNAPPSTKILGSKLSNIFENGDEKFVAAVNASFYTLPFNVTLNGLSTVSVMEVSSTEGLRRVIVCPQEQDTSNPPIDNPSTTETNEVDRICSRVRTQYDSAIQSNNLLEAKRLFEILIDNECISPDTPFPDSNPTSNPNALKKVYYFKIKLNPNQTPSEQVEEVSEEVERIKRNENTQTEQKTSDSSGINIRADVVNIDNRSGSNEETDSNEDDDSRLGRDGQSIESSNLGGGTSGNTTDFEDLTDV